MTRFFMAFLVVFAFSSCDFSKNEPQEKEGAKIYDMYEPSEMSIHMNEIYNINENIKKEILSGGVPKEFPKEFLKIHTATFSEHKGRNETFDRFSYLFVERMEMIYDTTSTVPLKQRYNDAITLCISCHTTECTGPIPRIKKLLIN